MIPIRLHVVEFWTDNVSRVEMPSYIIFRLPSLFVELVEDVKHGIAITPVGRRGKCPANPISRPDRRPAFAAAILVAAHP
jgi:hypothetical protein